MRSLTTYGYCTFLRVTGELSMVVEPTRREEESKGDREWQQHQLGCADNCTLAIQAPCGFLREQRRNDSGRTVMEDR
jgi:hypothetical protein